MSMSGVRAYDATQDWARPTWETGLVASARGVSWCGFRLNVLGDGALDTSQWGVNDGPLPVSLDRILPGLGVALVLAATLTSCGRAADTTPATDSGSCRHGRSSASAGAGTAASAPAARAHLERESGHEALVGVIRGGPTRPR